MKRCVLLIALLVSLKLLSSDNAFAAPNNEEPAPRISSVSMQAPNNIWYTGTGYSSHYFLVGQWAGKQLQLAPGLPPSQDINDHGESVLAVSKDDIWVIRGIGTIYHVHGTIWTEVPGPVDINRDISAMSAISPSDIWAVGSYNSKLGGNLQTYTMHWNGSTWHHIASPGILGFDTFFFALAAVSKNDVWAAGSILGINGGDTPLFEHWNGQNWQIVTSPPLTRLSSKAITALTAISKNDVWAAGGQGLVEHWNGQNWQIVINPKKGQSDILALSATGERDVWAAGGQGLIEHWNGQNWQMISLVPQGFSNVALVGMRVFSPCNVWVLGTGNTTISQVFLERWDGKSWQLVSTSKLG